MELNVSTWDVSEYLETEGDIVAYPNAALEDGDPALVEAALCDVAKSRGMTALAREVGVGDNPQ
ncbi:addiction module antidote protein [Corynebacterium cystitidis]|uniref:addiction module antidote protein n=1 Tax=Corynebacterium cystitidis TaxID=35757 RepID=UPI00211F28A6|nr:addiction module antidote protein [Corynebacterium cystitidis]